jgi:hypothetical protein
MPTDQQSAAASPKWHEKALPGHLLEPREQFAACHHRMVQEGGERLRHASVVFTGLARNCDGQLYGNLHRVLELAKCCGEWRLHIETNDNTDRTDEVLAAFCDENGQASYRSQALGRQQYGPVFSGPRTVALAEYRTACQQWVRDHAPESDYVIAIDFDAWGGWLNDGVLNGIGWLVELQGAYGMASVSLAEMEIPVHGRHWVHYDAWALRLNSYWDDYTANEGAWKHQWMPPVGSDPMRVCSAFGGLCIYKTDAYLAGTYDGAADCEHVTFHKSVAGATGQHLFLNPSQRMLMHWVHDGGRNSDD